MVSVCCIKSMPHVIYGARLYFVYRLYTVQFSLCTQKPVPLSGYNTHMITTIDQCKLDSGGERWSEFGDKRGEFHLHIFSILRFIFLSKDLLVY